MIKTFLWLNHGDVILSKKTNVKFVTINSYWENHPTRILAKLRVLDMNGEDTINPILDRDFIIYSQDKDDEFKILEYEVIGKMYLESHGGRYRKEQRDNPNAIFSDLPVPLTYSTLLPPENVLRDMPYWNDIGGKNLSIIDCIEWAILHLKEEDKKLPCIENYESIKGLESILYWQKTRRRLRQEQGVLGTNLPHKSINFNLGDKKLEIDAD